MCSWLKLTQVIDRFFQFKLQVRSQDRAHLHILTPYQNSHTHYESQRANDYADKLLQGFGQLLRGRCQQGQTFGRYD